MLPSNQTRVIEQRVLEHGLVKIIIVDLLHSVLVFRFVFFHWSVYLFLSSSNIKIAELI